MSEVRVDNSIPSNANVHATDEELKGVDPGLELIYGLHDRPPVYEAAFAGFQHLLAIFVSIMAPVAIFSNVMGFSFEMSSYLISMSLIVSGIATFIQCRGFGPVGSGLLSIQGTSFAFLGTLIASGFVLKGKGMNEEQIVTTLFGVCFVGSFIEMTASRFLPLLKKIITPLVSGIVVCMIGLYLIKVGVTDMGGGFGALKNKTFGNIENLALSLLVLTIIVILNRSKKPFIRMGAIFFGLLAGYIAAIYLGRIDFSPISKLGYFSFPIPFKYGFFGWDWEVFVPVALLFLITTVESVGDLTATSMISKQPIEGDKYIKTISAGVLGDGVNSAMAAVLNTFPNSTFSQNNGVIQMTGVASRYVGYFIAGFLILFGLFPVVGGLFKVIPPPVIGGALIITFGSIAAAGIKIIASSTIDRRGMMIIALSFSTGLGVVFQPDIISSFSPLFKNVFGSAVTMGGLTAIFLNIVMPRHEHEKEVGDSPAQVDIA